MAYFFWTINRRISALSWTFKWSYAFEIVRGVKTFAALSILAALFAQPEIVIMSFILGETEVGFYSAALKLVGFWLFLSTIYMSNVYPVLSRSYHKGDDKVQVIQDKSIAYLLALSLPLTAGILTAAEPIVNLFFGPGFENSVLLIRILCFDIPPAFVGAVLWRVLAAQGKQDSVLIVLVITVLIRLGGGSFLISMYGGVGAAAITTGSILINSLLLAYFVRRGGLETRIIKSGWRFALASLGMGMAIWGLSPFAPLWALIIAAGTIYALLVWLMRGFFC